VLGIRLPVSKVNQTLLAGLLAAGAAGTALATGDRFEHQADEHGHGRDAVNCRDLPSVRSTGLSSAWCAPIPAARTNMTAAVTAVQMMPSVESAARRRGRP
jgi:hypothetical protein